MTPPEVRKGMPPVKLDRTEFEKRCRQRYIDPASGPLQKELDAIIGAAWDAYLRCPVRIKLYHQNGGLC